MKKKLKSFSRKGAEVDPDAEIFHYLKEGGSKGDKDKPFEACVNIKHESLKKIPMLELCEQVAISCFVNETPGVESADKTPMEDGGRACWSRAGLATCWTSFRGAATSSTSPGSSRTTFT